MSEHDHGKKKDNITISKTTLWQGVSAILGVLLIISIATGGFGKGGMAESGGSVAQPQPAAAPTPAAPAPSVDPSIDLAELASDDPFLGPEDAKVVVVEFSDFECPFCGAAAGTHEGLISRFQGQDPTWEAAVPRLKQLAEEGKIKFVYRDFPLRFHPNAQKAAEAANCAHEQDMFWEMHDLLLENQEALGVDQLKAYAGQLGLNQGDFDECLDSGRQAQEVIDDMAYGQRVGVSGTPAFFVNGELIGGAQPFAAFESLINRELAR